MIRVFLVDDQALVRAGFAMLIGSQPDMTVAGEAADGDEAVRTLGRVPADVVLMDVRMPRMDGVTATRRLTADGPAPRVLVLTTYDLDEYAFAALRAGASGFLLKDARPEDLLDAVRIVHRGEAVIAPSTTRRLIDRWSPELPCPDGGRDPLTGLTAREREVFGQLARGLSNAEIADALTLGGSTIKTHMNNVLGKLHLRDRVQATIFAYDVGLVRPGA